MVLVGGDRPRSGVNNVTGIGHGGGNSRGL
jgi:hypothetical protein